MLAQSDRGRTAPALSVPTPNDAVCPRDTFGDGGKAAGCCVADGFAEGCPRFSSQGIATAKLSHVRRGLIPTENGF
jgi:hypothetical protein